MILVWRLTATRQAFTFLARNGFINRFLIKQTETRRDVIILRRCRLDFNVSRKPVLHPTNGCKGAVSDFVFTCVFTFGLCVFGFAPR